MRFLFVNQYYWPDVASTGQHLTDLAEHLAAAGHEVQVLCSAGNYLGGEGSTPAVEDHEGVEIRRVRGTRLGQRGSRLGRIVDYAAFHCMAGLRTVFARRADVVVTLTTPPLLGLWGALAARLRRTRHVNFVMDLHPDAEFAAGMLKRTSLLGRLLEGLNAFALRAADLNVCLGPYQGARVLAKGVGCDRVAEIPIWSDGQEINPIDFDRHLTRERNGWGDKFVVLYSGNAGLVHRFDEILEAAQRLELRAPDVLFCFQGGGPRRAEIQAFVERHGLKNVELRPYVERSELSNALSAADCHFMSLEPAQTGIAVPGKLQGILAAGRPVLFTGAERCESADWIRAAGAGRAFGVDDVDGLIGAILEWRADAQLVVELGARARDYFDANFERELCCEAWREVLERTAQGLLPGTEPADGEDSEAKRVPRRAA